ncbi:MAG: 50S ribosomal protein L24 [Candidatus Daviesbacteria bacterium]|nr:50S ribosomal protein L24 [Candidatus Daviesbacteria bacterium]
MKIKIKKDDLVQILLGKDRTKTGKVLRVFSKVDKVLVEGVNSFKRHVKKMQGSEGGIVQITKPVNISNVALVCPSCKKPTRVGFKVVGENKVRICKKCQKEIK